MYGNWQRRILLVRDERHPVNNLGNTLKVVRGGHMRDTILVHDLSATQLQIGCVDFTTKELVDGCCSCENDWLTLDLDGPLPQADEVSTDT